MTNTKYDAVIACGGQGTRLKDLTKDLPKPLFPINNKSTLERSLDQLYLNGIKNVLITSGYKSKLFKEFLIKLKKNSSIRIDLFVEDKPLGESGALWLLKEKLSDNFLFINGDLIYSMDLEKLILFHNRLNSNLTLVTHTSDHPDDSDLLIAPNGSLVENIFLKNISYKKNKFAYLGNSGICVINKRIFDFLDYPKAFESKSIFHFLVNEIFKKKINIFTYITSEYIKDMGTPKRFYSIETDLKKNKVHRLNYKNKQKALFVDRDNTLIKCDVGTYILDVNNISFLEENILKIALVAKQYDLVCLVTNQPTISMGKLTLKKLDEINSVVIKFCLLKNLKIDIVTFCPHHPHKGFEGEISALKMDCFCRKPNPGMFLEQAFLRNIELTESLLIGDSKQDQIAAKNSGCNFINIDDL